MKFRQSKVTRAQGARLSRCRTTPPPGTRWRWLSLVVIVLLPMTANRLSAQESSIPSEKSQSEKSQSSGLTEGLLDLLKEPPSVKQPTTEAPELTPAEVGLDGEDLGEQSANPLESVRQSMLIAAGFLGRGSVGTDTQQLQSDIVQRLDELITDLENSKSTQSSSQSSSSENSPASPEQTAQQKQSQPQEAGDGSPQEMNSPEASSTTTGQNGVPSEAAVDLADPKALQESVWGHLPERMRTQMQSRMVEQFLPSYREQIEAYFKALLESE